MEPRFVAGNLQLTPAFANVEQVAPLLAEVSLWPPWFSFNRALGKDHLPGRRSCTGLLALTRLESVFEGSRAASEVSVVRLFRGPISRSLQSRTSVALAPGSSERKGAPGLLHRPGTFGGPSARVPAQRRASAQR